MSTRRSRPVIAQSATSLHSSKSSVLAMRAREPAARPVVPIRPADAPAPAVFPPDSPAGMANLWIHLEKEK